MEQQHGEALHRGLKTRHIQLIALGGAGRDSRLCDCRIHCLSDYAPVR